MSSVITRTISGAIYIAILITSLLWNQYAFLAVMLFFLAVMMYEFMHFTMGGSYKFTQSLTIIAAMAFFGIIWSVRALPNVHGEFTFLSFLPLFCVMILSLYVKDKTEFGKFSYVYTALIYIAIPFSITNFLVLDINGNFNGILLLLFFSLIWMGDVAAYCFGITLGQKFGKKLFPSISPKKSWVGFWGGMFGTVALSLAYCYIATPNEPSIWYVGGLGEFPWYHAVGLAVVMNIAGVYGDLFESQWKRYYEVKDSGKIIPGHGGLLDRLDSTLFAVPVGFIYLSIFKMINIIL